MRSSSIEGDNKMMNFNLRKSLRFIAVFILVISYKTSLHSFEKIIPLSNLNAPERMVIDSERIYVEDRKSIKLFNKSDFVFIKTIGREGQGPGEFQDFAIPQILPDKILVSTANKISYFSFDGELIEERKNTQSDYGIKAVNQNYIGFDWVFIEDYVAYILYDSDLKPIKELHRGKAIIHPNRRRDFFEIHFYDVQRDKIVIAQREGFEIDIFDSEGKLLHSIKHKVKAIPFSKNDKDDVVNYWREERGYEQWQIDSLLKRTDFPEFFPPIQTCRLADGKIYVITYKKIDDKNECLIFDMSGEFIKDAYFPLKMMAPNHACPFAIYENTLYQLIFNYDFETWELHINQID